MGQVIYMDTLEEVACVAAELSKTGVCFTCERREGVWGLTFYTPVPPAIPSEGKHTGDRNAIVNDIQAMVVLGQSHIDIMCSTLKSEEYMETMRNLSKLLSSIRASVKKLGEDKPDGKV